MEQMKSRLFWLGITSRGGSSSWNYNMTGMLVTLKKLLPIFHPIRYRPRINSERFRGEHLLLILPVAHKYCMENTEEDIITELKKASDSEGFVDLIVASRMVDSDRLYQDGIQRLISSEIPPTLEQAKRMGAEANHTVMSQIMENKIRYLTTTHQTALNQLTTSHRAALRATESRKCRFCAQISTKWSCFSCGKSNLS